MSLSLRTKQKLKKWVDFPPLLTNKWVKSRTQKDTRRLRSKSQKRIKNNNIYKEM